MKNLTDRQINNTIIRAEVEMEELGELTWTTSMLLIRALKQIEN